MQAAATAVQLSLAHYHTTVRLQVIKSKLASLNGHFEAPIDYLNKGYHGETTKESKCSS